MTPLSAERTLHDRAHGAPAPRRQWPTSLFVAALVVVAFGYLWFVRTHCAYYASGSDASGYLNVARLLRSGEFVQPVPHIEGLAPPSWPYIYQQPLGFVVKAETDTFITTYPVGLPLHFLAAAPFVGLEFATIAVNVFLAASAALLMVALGRQLGLPWVWAVAGAALLWACPLFILFVNQPMSDVCATVWTLAVFSTALLTRRHWAWGFAAGAVFAVSVLVRPTDLLLIVPLAFVVRFRLRAWLAIIVGGIPGAAFLAWYNLKLYGSVLTTGYGNIGPIFGLRFAAHNVAHFAIWLPLLLSPFVLVAALGALLRLRRESPGVVAMLALWCAAFVGFYVFYFHSGETWWYLRFILPMFPAVILAGLLVTHRTFGQPLAQGWRKWAPLLLLVGALAWEIVCGHRLIVTQTKADDRPYLQAVHWMQTHAPANAIVLQMQTSGSFTFYTSFTIVRWDIINGDAWNRLCAVAQAAGRPLYATLFEFEERRAFPNILSGRWERVAQLHQISIWRLVEAPPSLPAP